MGQWSSGAGAGVIAIVSLVLSGTAQAHTRSESYSTWQVDGTRVVAEVTVSAGEVAALMTGADPQPLETLFASHLSSSIGVSAAAGDCMQGDTVPLAAPRGFLRVEIEFDCGERPAQAVHYRALMDALPAHVHYARLFEGGRLVSEQVLTDRSDTWQLVDGPPPATFTSYLALGLSHILGGFDHIAFLLGMLLVAGTFGRSIVAVTGFTLGHSVSLAAAVLGYLQADGRLVESFIGFTVALVAVEYCLGRRADRTVILIVLLAAWATGIAAVAAGTVAADTLPMYLGFGLFAACYLALSTGPGGRADGSGSSALFAVTAAFGLIHGFGFAGFLMETGISGRSLALPLLGFNVGVELGQLALVAAAFAAGAVLQKTPVGRLSPAAAAGLCGIGVYWFVGRSLGV